MLIYACSTNTGKLREFTLAARQVSGHEITVEVLPGINNISPPEETGSTFEENATLKAVYYSQFTQELVLADDSGLSVDSLHGAPGVLSARYAGPHATDAENNLLLLRDLGEVAYRAARFICVLAVAKDRKPATTAFGSVEGEILTEPRGNGGFGYDALFFYPPLKKSFGELTPEEKFGVSHRGRALRDLFKQLISPIT